MAASMISKIEMNHAWIIDAPNEKAFKNSRAFDKIRIDEVYTDIILRLLF